MANGHSEVFATAEIPSHEILHMVALSLIVLPFVCLLSSVSALIHRVTDERGGSGAHGAAQHRWLLLTFGICADTVLVVCGRNSFTLIKE